jgi:hypothetical protein
MIRSVVTYCKKYIGSPYFLPCVLCVTAISFFSTAFQTIEGVEYTVIQTIFRICAGTLSAAEEDLSALDLFNQGFDENFLILIPILASAPFVLPTCAEIQSKNLRFTLSRIGICHLCLARLLAAVITGGLVLVAGRFLYGILLLPFFPAVSPYEEITTAFVLQKIGKKLLGTFLIGGGNVLVSYLLTFLTTNLYLILCIPFLLNYLLSYAISWLGTIFFDDISNPFLFLKSESLQGVGYLTETAIKSLLCYALLSVFCYLFGILSMRRRGDCGE